MTVRGLLLLAVVVTMTLVIAVPASAAPGSALAWGYNRWGQLGDGSTSESDLLVAVSGRWPGGQDGAAVVSILAGAAPERGLSIDRAAPELGDAHARFAVDNRRKGTSRQDAWVSS